jgi:hypothetical protein
VSALLTTNRFKIVNGMDRDDAAEFVSEIQVLEEPTE